MCREAESSQPCLEPGRKEPVPQLLIYRQVVTETLNYRIKDKCASCIRRAHLSSIGVRSQRQGGPARLPGGGRGSWGPGVPLGRPRHFTGAQYHPQAHHPVFVPAHFTMGKACSALRTEAPGVCCL